MVTIPRLNNRVQSQSSPGVRVSTQTPIGTFGGDTSVTKAVSGLSDTAFKVVLDQRNKADDTMLLNASTSLDNLELIAMQERNKYQGEKALGYPEIENDLINKNIEEISSKLTSDRQRERFRKLEAATRYNINKKTIQHVAQQSEIFQQKSYTSHIANKKNVLLNKYNNEGDYSDIARGLMEMADDTYKYIGDRFGEEKAKEEVDKITSDVHSNIVLKLAEQSEENAMDYFNKREDGILPEERRKVKSDIKTITDKKNKEANIRNSYQSQQIISDSIEVINQENVPYAEKRQVIEDYKKSGLVKDADYNFLKGYLDSQNDPEASTYNDILSDVALKIDEVNGGLELSKGSKDIKSKEIKEKVLPYLEKVKDLRNYMMSQKARGQLNQYDFDRLNKELNEKVIDEEQLITNKIKPKGNYKFKETYNLFLKNYNGNIIKTDDAFKEFYYATAENPKMNNEERIKLREKIMNDITAKYNNQASETVTKLDRTPKPSNLVSIIGTDGKSYKVPKENLEKALERGYKLAR